MRLSMIIGASAIVGAIVSALLLIADTLTEGDWMSLQMPGISAAYLFWGAVGSSVPIGIAICWLVNAVVYAVPAFVLLLIFNTIARTLRGKNAA